MTTHRWWEQGYGFFGDFYIEGDDSKEGYAAKSQTLSERTATEVQGILSLLDLPPGGQVLDVPCGYGRHTIPLQQKGFSVTGVDINDNHLHIAKKTAKTAGVSITWMKESMLSLPFHEQFDAVINMFLSFGFFEKDEENLAVMKNFFAALKTGGKLLLHTDVNVPRLLNGTYPLHETRHLASGNVLTIKETYNPQTKRLEGSWTIASPQGTTKRDYSVRVYSQEEFRDLCIRAGFETITFFGGWDGRPYSADSEDLILIAEKP